MSAPFSLNSPVPTPNEAMRSVLRSFDEGTPPFMAHRAELAEVAAISASSRRRPSSKARTRSTARR